MAVNRRLGLPPTRICFTICCALVQLASISFASDAPRLAEPSNGAATSDTAPRNEDAGDLKQNHEGDVAALQQRIAELERQLAEISRRLPKPKKVDATRNSASDPARIGGNNQDGAPKRSFAEEHPEAARRTAEMLSGMFQMDPAIVEWQKEAQRLYGGLSRREFNLRYGPVLDPARNRELEEKHNREMQEKKAQAARQSDTSEQRGASGEDGKRNAANPSDSGASSSTRQRIRYLVASGTAERIAQALSVFDSDVVVQRRGDELTITGTRAAHEAVRSLIGLAEEDAGAQ